MAKHRNWRHGVLYLFLDSVLAASRLTARASVGLACALLLCPGIAIGQVESAAQITARLDSALHSQASGSFEEIQSLIDTALIHAESSRDLSETSSLLRARWLLALYENDLQMGKEALQEAIDLLVLDRASPGEIASLQRDLAYTNILMGQFGEAIRILRRCVVYRLSAENPAELERDLYSLGDAYLKNGELEIARRYFAQVLVIGSSAPITAAASQLKLGSISRLEGDVKSALAKHAAMRPYFQENSLYRVIVADIELARDYLAAGELERPQRTRDEHWRTSALYWSKSSTRR